MGRLLAKWGVILFLFFVFIGIFVYLARDWSVPSTQLAIRKQQASVGENFGKLQEDLEDPGEAPSDIREMVLLGFHIVTETSKYAAEYSGDRLDCKNCHFGGGITTGGKGGGISLAGVATKYPTYNKRAGKVIDLATRINDCFYRSMNGKPLPYDSKEMTALLAYFQWISKDMPIYRIVPWLGLKTIHPEKRGDQKSGKNVYNKHCALCHGKGGQGSKGVPPLWGGGSFNIDSGMGRQEVIQAFVYWNMPYLDPGLTEQEAADVSAYVLEMVHSQSDGK